MRALKLGLALALTIAHPALAAPAAPGPERYVAEALRRSPALAAAERRSAAAAARIRQAGLLPDPMLEAGLMSLLSGQGPQAAVSQTFPLGGKLDAARRLAEADAGRAGIEVASVRSETALATRLAYWDWAAAAAEREATVRSQALADQAAQLVSRRLAVGQASQAEAWRAATQAASVRQERLAAEQRLAEAAQRLAEQLNRNTLGPEARPGALPSLPALPDLPPLERLVSEAEARHPLIRAARADEARREAEGALAGTLATPDLSVKLGIGQYPMGTTWGTMASGMVGTSLPWPWGAQRRDAAVASAREEARAQASALEAARLKVRTGLAVSLQRLERSRQITKLFETAVLPQARRAWQAETFSYPVGRGSFDGLLQSRLGLVGAERDARLALVAYWKAEAELRSWRGLDAAESEAQP